MHYTGMAAARFDGLGRSSAPTPGAVVATGGLVVFLAIGALIVLAVGSLGAALDRQHERQLAARIQAEEARYLSLAQSVTDAIVSVSAQGTIVFWNAAAERIFGCSADEALGRPLSSLISKYHDELDRLITQSAVLDGFAPARSVELPGHRSDGSEFPMELALGRWQDGTERFVTAIIRDVTARREGEDALRDSEGRFRALVEHSPEAIVLHADGSILYANPAFARLIGAYDGSSLSGVSLTNLVHPDSRSVLAERLRTDVASLRGTVNYRLMHRNGQTVDVESSTAASVFNGRPARQTHLRDVTAQRKLEAELSHQAFHDTLTGLSNRSLFRNRVEHALECSRRSGSPPAVLFLDLDNFKAVNDGLGHSAGDELLGTIARRLRFTTRAADTCARLGGDEFAVLIEQTHQGADASSRAAHLAARLLTALAAPCRAGGSDVVVSASVGIAVAGGDSTVDDLLRNADVAMYRAKAAGKGRYEVFEPAMQEIVRRRLSLESDLRRAVEERLDPAACQFALQYQPIVALASGRVDGFEALARWHHPRLGLIPPSEFVPIAEETGMIIALGNWILTEACTRVRRWQLDGIGGEDASHIGVSVNLSARQVVQPGLACDVEAALRASGLAAKHLLLEVTESLYLDASETTTARLGALKELGVRVAIDDFGTGYSSLGYLERFPVDFLKIDRSFIERIGESPVPRAIIGLGHELRMRVVAEGVETAEQWERLCELGCDFGQGYYFGRPADPCAVTPLDLAPAPRGAE
jgi:diguanylate cyclase (GGDEF)-like protein/PAS domain S-box-containing protein